MRIGTKSKYSEEGMKNLVLKIIIILAIIAGTASAQDQIEKKKIDFLIASVEGLQGAKFIRNGTEYNGKEAADHLRLKYKSAGDRVKTADDFIRLCASKSSMSGKPYKIKYSDGKIINSEQ